MAGRLRRGHCPGDLVPGSPAGGAGPVDVQGLLARRPASPRPARLGTARVRCRVHLARLRGGNGRRGPRLPARPALRGNGHRAGPGFRRGRADRRRGQAAERHDRRHRAALRAPAVLHRSPRLPPPGPRPGTLAGRDGLGTSQGHRIQGHPVLGQPPRRAVLPLPGPGRHRLPLPPRDPPSQQAITR